MTHGTVSSSLIWPPFPSLSYSWLDEFSLREVPCVLSWVQWQELVLWRWFLTPTFLASWVSQPLGSKHLTLDLQMSVSPSCEHLHKFSIRAGTDSAGHCIRVTRESKAFWCQVHCADHRSSPEFFFKHRRLFVKSSHILGVPLWICTWKKQA